MFCYFCHKFPNVFYRPCVGIGLWEISKPSNHQTSVKETYRRIHTSGQTDLMIYVLIICYRKNSLNAGKVWLKKPKTINHGWFWLNSSRTFHDFLGKPLHSSHNWEDSATWCPSAGPPGTASPSRARAGGEMPPLSLLSPENLPLAYKCTFLLYSLTSVVLSC